MALESYQWKDPGEGEGGGEGKQMFMNNDLNNDFTAVLLDAISYFSFL